jgi:hypothetical protein
MPFSPVLRHPPHILRRRSPTLTHPAHSLPADSLRAPAHHTIAFLTEQTRTRQVSISSTNASPSTSHGPGAAHKLRQPGCSHQIGSEAVNGHAALDGLIRGLETGAEDGVG